MMVHNRRAWLNRAGGGYACLRFTCAPLLDTAGLQIGTRGVATLEATDEAPMAYAPDDAPGEPRTGRRADDPTADPLADAPTGLMSRQTFLRALSRSLERLDWDALPGTLMHAGIEGLAELNATLGPAQGDAVMAAVGRLLSHSLRTEDLVARLDGTTFAMWMAGADHMTAAERAEMLQSTLPRMVAALVGPDAPKVGIAIGIAPRHHGDETVDMLLRRAERALSAVREGGTGWLVAHVTEP
jgi:diguanylate cyclase (GGDEF)-like protein